MEENWHRGRQENEAQSLYKLNRDEGTLGESYEAIIWDRRRKKEKETRGHNKFSEFSL